MGVNDNESTYDIIDNGEFVVDYGNKGKIHGYTECSTRSATNPWVGTNGVYVLQSDGATTALPDSTGKYCYCQLDGYTPLNGSMRELSAPWVFDLEYYENSDCGDDCASHCANSLKGGSAGALSFRSAVFGLL